MSEPAKENKVRRVERLKREKNPWECFDEIERFAGEGYASIPPEWLGTYFRWWGIYTQGDGRGAVGGTGGEGKAVAYFMVRIRLPNGLLFSHQLRTIANLADKYARGVADLTVRQNIQLHWVTIEALPGLMRELWRCGLTTVSSCGDVTRNITGCPNSCGQHWIADIGIEGKKLKVDGRMVDAYYFCVGGAVGKFQGIARPMGYRCAASEVPAAIERLLREYMERRVPGENLRQFFARHADAELRSVLAGEEVKAVARDLSPGPPPHGVDG